MGTFCGEYSVFSVLGEVGSLHYLAVACPLWLAEPLRCWISHALGRANSFEFSLLSVERRPCLLCLQLELGLTPPME